MGLLFLKPHCKPVKPLVYFEKGVKKSRTVLILPEDWLAFFPREITGKDHRRIQFSAVAPFNHIIIGHTFLQETVHRVMGNVTITHDEIEGIMVGLLYTDSPPTGRTRLTEWAGEHASVPAKHYASDLARRKKGAAPYRL